MMKMLLLALVGTCLMGAQKADAFLGGDKIGSVVVSNGLTFSELAERSAYTADHTKIAAQYIRSFTIAGPDGRSTFSGDVTDEHFPVRQLEDRHVYTIGKSILTADAEGVYVLRADGKVLKVGSTQVESVGHFGRAVGRALLDKNYGFKLTAIAKKTGSSCTTKYIDVCLGYSNSTFTEWSVQLVDKTSGEVLFETKATKSYLKDPNL